MAKSPKRKNSETEDLSSNKRSKSFEFGKVENGVEPSGSDFGDDLPTPFDTMVTEQSLALPKASSPTTNLASPQNISATDSKATSTTSKQSQKAEQKKNNGAAAGAAAGTVGKPQQSDPDKLSDALLSAGVDIREEEALLSSTVARTKATGNETNNLVPAHPPFLHPKNVSDFMKRIASEQNFHQDFNKNADILGLMSTACELYMRDIITNSLILSVHRRKGVKLNTGRRSEVSRSLRDLALRQKSQEERRVKRRIALGLEKQITNTRLDTEETQYRASNATANLMIAGGNKKKYSWLTAGSKSSSTDLKNQGNVSSAVAARGEMGIKYREAREEPGIVMRDLLLALENRRVGVNNIVTKGYARIRD
ncbi:unnamed protein product [Kluyveromyces dobzhanskii CBS 2104]|uniref:Transcription initiation factor TFIID subunit 4 n=1 Tax=Kluyveromyces dobzhanskii CBS 2104 TaxID=1427455 RepID=A0A0A8L406_9SACH|nr:unnamed protein product [Kluyveromyces dobzhanskii CBS 2104]